MKHHSLLFEWDELKSTWSCHPRCPSVTCPEAPEAIFGEMSQALVDPLRHLWRHLSLQGVLSSVCPNKLGSDRIDHAWFLNLHCAVWCTKWQFANTLRKKNTFVKVFTVRLTASNVCKYMYINSNFDISNVNSLILWPWYTRCTSDHHLGLLADVAPGSSKSDVGKAVEIPTRGTTESSQTNEEKTDPCTIHNFQQS